MRLLHHATTSCGIYFRSLKRLYSAISTSAAGIEATLRVLVPGTWSSVQQATGCTTETKTNPYTPGVARRTALALGAGSREQANNVIRLFYLACPSAGAFRVCLLRVLLLF